MAGSVSHLQVVLAIFAKDLRLYARDMMFVFLTILGVATFATLYWVLPRDVNETITLGVRGSQIRPALEQFAAEEEEGLGLTWYDSTSTLVAAVENRELDAGIEFADRFVEAVRAGQLATVTVYVRPNLPEEVVGAMESMVREISYAIAGFALPVSEPRAETVVLGEDRAGNQIPFRERLRPLYAFFILIIEAMSLGTLIASEVQERTVTAILSTPARLSDIILAKLILGTLIAFSEAAVILALIRGFGASPGIVALAVLLGAVMVTGVAMIAGSAGRDLIGTMLLGIVFLIPLAIPAFAVLFPGAPAPWVRYLPTYGIVEVIRSAAAGDYGWADSARSLLLLLGWCLLFAFLGVAILKRRVETL